MPVLPHAVATREVEDACGEHQQRHSRDADPPHRVPNQPHQGGGSIGPDVPSGRDAQAPPRLELFPPDPVHWTAQPGEQLLHLPPRRVRTPCWGPRDAVGVRGDSRARHALARDNGVFRTRALPGEEGPFIARVAARVAARGTGSSCGGSRGRRRCGRAESSPPHARRASASRGLGIARRCIVALCGRLAFAARPVRDATPPVRALEFWGGRTSDRPGERPPRSWSSRGTAGGGGGGGGGGD
mmetsp:Transcript_29023/g.67634  ORF Transcript_29023/g.67634 Transcript_29023/m.67634 type:complete len:242 (+) Transcript_29023:240-965(+)